VGRFIAGAKSEGECAGAGVGAGSGGGQGFDGRGEDLGDKHAGLLRVVPGIILCAGTVELMDNRRLGGQGGPLGPMR